MQKTFVACLVCVATLGLVVGWIVLTRPARETPKLTSTVKADATSETWRDRVFNPNDGKTPAEIADAEYNNLHDAKQRKELVDWISQQPWADYKTSVLRKALIADPDGSVQLTALDRSVKLAESGRPVAMVEVIRAGLSCANSKVIQQSLREARKHPRVELVPDLLEVADSKDSHRFLAVDALASTDDPRARAKVIEVASRDDGDKTERVRAVALLSKVNDERALALLGQLSCSADQEVRKVALEALAAREAR